MPVLLSGVFLYEKIDLRESIKQLSELASLARLEEVTFLQKNQLYFYILELNNLKTEINLKYFQDMYS